MENYKKELNSLKESLNNILLKSKDKWVINFCSNVLMDLYLLEQKLSAIKNPTHIAPIVYNCLKITKDKYDKNKESGEI